MIVDVMLLILILGFIIGFILAFSMGANDVANSFGTSVGSRVLTFKQACILATIFETLGSVLLGGRVSGTIAKGIVDLELYANKTQELQLGYLSSLVGASGWLLIATVFKFPVSGTHSIVGAVLGFTLVANGAVGVHWMALVKVVSSWFTSPILSGITSAGIFILVKKLVLKRPNKLESGARILPVLYGLTLAANIYMVLDESFEVVKVDMPTWATFLIALGVGVICWFLAHLFLMPWILKKISKKVADATSKLAIEPSVTPDVDLEEYTEHHLKFEETEAPPTPTTSPLPHRIFPFLNVSEQDSGHASALSLTDTSTPPSRAARSFKKTHRKRPSTDSSEEESVPIDIKTEAGQSKVVSALGELENLRKRKEIEEHMLRKIAIQEPDEVRHLFSCIQVVTAIFASFAHGGNDVSNAVGPIIGMFALYQTGILGAPSPHDAFQWLVLCFGGVGISAGLWLLGRRVMSTIGHDLATISPASGFCIEFGAALTVLIASHLGIPVSTTHCLVGSVVLVGFVRSRQSVDWKLTRNIIFSWGVTVPAACAISAASYAGLRAAFSSFLPPQQQQQTLPMSVVMNNVTSIN